MKLDAASRCMFDPEPAPEFVPSNPVSEERLIAAVHFADEEEPVPPGYWEELTKTLEFFEELGDADFELEPFL